MLHTPSILIGAGITFLIYHILLTRGLWEMYLKEAFDEAPTLDEVLEETEEFEEWMQKENSLVDNTPPENERDNKRDE